MIKQSLIDPEIKARINNATRIFGTFLIVLSGCILYLDKIFLYSNITLKNTHGWRDTETYVWHLCQTISPVLIMFGMYLRAYTLATIVPIFCYVLQFFFVLDSSMTIDKGSTWLYVIGTSIGIMIVFTFIKLHLIRIGKVKKLKIELMEDLIQTDTDIFDGHEVVKKENREKKNKRL